jgi:predicted transcriptional regulator
MSFKQEFAKLLEKQKKMATGQRLEMLNRDLSGTEKLLEVVIWPILHSFEGIVLEYELVSLTGVKVYIDAFYVPLFAALESEGFVVHAEKVTRDRFSFERMKVRTITLQGFNYLPFSRDGLDKKPDICIRSMYELLGRYSITTDKCFMELSVYEREVLRYGLTVNRPFRVSEIQQCLQLGREACRKVLRSLLDLGLVKSNIEYVQRMHTFILTAKGRSFLLAPRK